jgi:hypothetical protein
MHHDAPGPPYKGFFLLRDKRARTFRYGWTESLWINGDSFPASLAALEEIAVPRQAILPAGFVIERLKVTNPLLPRAVEDRWHYNQEGQYQGEARPAWTLLLVRLQHETFSTRYNLGGVPKDVASVRGIHPTPAWQAAFDRFAALIRKHCVMVNEQRERDGEEAAVPVSFSQEQAWARITTAVDFFAAADVHQRVRVKLSGAGLPPALTGSQDVLVLDSRNALTPTVITLDPNLPAGGISIRKQQKLIHPVSKVSILRVSSRKRGLGHGYPSPGRRKRRL